MTLMSGCVGPAAYVQRYGFNARLVDGANHEPLSRLATTIAVDDRTFSRRTSAEGRIRAKPDYGWYLTWALCGPVIIDTNITHITISPQGYRPFEATIPSRYTLRSYDDMLFPEKRMGVYELGEIQMEKRQQPP